MAKIETIDANVRKAGKAEWHSTVNREIERLRAALKVDSVGGTLTRNIRESHSMIVKAQDGSRIHDGSVTFDNAPGALLCMLAAALLTNGTANAEQKAIDAFLKKIDGLAESVAELQQYSHAHHE